MCWGRSEHTSTVANSAGKVRAARVQCHAISIPASQSVKSNMKTPWSSPENTSVRHGEVRIPGNTSCCTIAFRIRATKQNIWDLTMIIILGKLEHIVDFSEVSSYSSA